VSRLPPLPFKSQLIGPDGLITQWWADWLEKVIKRNTESVGTERLDDEAVTLPKIQNIASDRLLGRDTVGSGSPEEISLAGGLDFNGSGGLRRSALTGDVTAAAGDNATTIADNSVNYAKLFQDDWTANTAINGYTKLPNGIYFHWGSVTVGSGATGSVSFVTAFPVACRVVVASPFGNNATSTASTGSWGTGNYSTTGFDLYNRTTLALDFRWMAVGN
jgi:hypothetical protein